MGLQAVSNRKTPAVVTVDDKEEPTSRMVTSLEGLKALIGVVIVSAVGIFMSTAWIQVRGLASAGTMMYLVTEAWLETLTRLTVCMAALLLLQVMIWCAPALIGYTLLSIALLGVGSAITFFATGKPLYHVARSFSRRCHTGRRETSLSQTDSMSLLPWPWQATSREVW